MILVVVCRILVSLADTYITIPASPESVVSGEAPDTVRGTESGEREPPPTSSGDGILGRDHRHCAAIS